MMSKVTLFNRVFATIWVLGAVIALSGCSNPMPARVAISAADAAVNRAIEARGAQHAPMALHLARQKLDSAKAAFSEDEYDAARRQAEEAQVEARFAESSARAERAQSQVEEIKKAIDTLKHEAGR